MRIIYLLGLLTIPPSLLVAQNIDSTVKSISQLPGEYIPKVDDKISSIDEKLTKQTVKYLQKLQRQEDKINKRLSKIDSSASASFQNSKQKYAELLQGIKSKTAFASKLSGG